MPILQSELIRASSRGTIRKSALARTGQPTAFLCHSHMDSAMAEGLQTMLHEAGWEVYIDWQDADMPASPNRSTASRIQNRIVSADWFLFLATVNSTASKWCPWEIGYADGKKPAGRIAVIPTADASGRHHGNEYLQLYPQITPAGVGGLALFPAGQSSGGNFVRNL
ncbi:toll/interleukin-1 receptor domain-containing protein [Duganella sp. S19_KUP01_CR8]|uniref:toll/interleukin-1 receptor domain-containing protein n=1 Tax=Duganella sp. S19_KUP01_CR8 TaxID=3025502 RepID=UPI002FCD929E